MAHDYGDNTQYIFESLEHCLQQPQTQEYELDHGISVSSSQMSMYHDLVGAKEQLMPNNRMHKELKFYSPTRQTLTFDASFGQP